MSITDLEQYRHMNDEGNPGIAVILKIMAWLTGLAGAGLIIAAFADASNREAGALLVSGCGAIASGLFMGGFSVLIEKAAAIERNTRKIAESATRRDAASA